MTAVPTRRLLADARTAGRGIGAFNVVQLEHAEAIAAGAERAGLPVIMQISENTVTYHGALAPLGRAVVELAGTTTVPVAVHLDHATRPDLVEEAVRLGFGSVMFDASTRPYADNVAATAEVTAACHRADVGVEAELGEVGGKDGAHAPGARTDPREAAAFADATGVDALAVAVGTSHAMTTRDARVDLALVERLRAAVRVPLVLHGSSGVGDDDLVRVVRAGMTKINIATHLNKALTHAVRDALAADAELVDPRRYLGPGRDAVTAEVERLLRLLAEA